MDDCKYCGYTGGNHSIDCPNHHANCLVKVAATEDWSAGYSDGRAGKEMAVAGRGDSYRLGWIKGDIALDEAENGSQLWAD